MTDVGYDLYWLVSMFIPFPVFLVISSLCVCVCVCLNLNEVIQNVVPIHYYRRREVDISKMTIEWKIVKVPGFIYECNE